MKLFSQYLFEDDERVPFRMSSYNEDNGGFAKLARIVKDQQKAGKKPTKTVKLKGLKASQEWLDPNRGGKQPFEYDDKPIVFHIDNHDVILDGHHRLSSKIEDGETECEVYYYEEL